MEVVDVEFDTLTRRTQATCVAIIRTDDVYAKAWKYFLSTSTPHHGSNDNDWTHKLQCG